MIMFAGFGCQINPWQIENCSHPPIFAKFQCICDGDDGSHRLFATVSVALSVAVTATNPTTLPTLAAV